MVQHLSAIWRFRHFWMSLVRLDLRNRYRRSALGVGWSLLHPLAMTVVWCVAFGNVLGMGNWREYAPFLLAGMAVWQFVTGSVSVGCDSFIRAEAYIRQCPLPFGIYPLRTVLGTLIHFLISVGLVVATVAVVSGNTDALAAVPAVVPAILLTTAFCWSLATLAAFANVFFHDTKHLSEVVIQIFFFLTPIMYPARVLEKQGLGWLIDLNPANYFLDLIRPTLLDGTVPTAELYVQCGVITAVAFGLACGAMAWLQRKVIFYL